MLLNHSIIPWIVPVINVKLIFLSSDCTIMFNTSTELYDCAVGFLFAIYHYTAYCSKGIALHDCTVIILRPTETVREQTENGKATPGLRHCTRNAEERFQW